MDVPDTVINDFVLDQNNCERKSWSCFDHEISRSFAVFITQVSVAMFIIIFSCVNLYLSKRCEESTIWIAVLSSAVGYFLPNPQIK